ncbi:MAG: hypothetical protein R3310_15205, partial [Candidatus Competibacteraceae bacterium]|nr:hypothetical protein [Candidatus Competibacteraceae bacterium]
MTRGRPMAALLGLLLAAGRQRRRQAPVAPPMEETPMNQSPLPPPALDKSWNAHRALIYTGVTVAVVLLLLALWYLSDVVLLTFAGILLAIFLRGLALGLCHWTRIPLGLGIILVIL